MVNGIRVDKKYDLCNKLDSWVSWQLLITVPRFD